jgi:hypothetical protein
MLSWIPLLGPILQGLFSTASSIYSTFKSTEVEQIKADVETAKISADIIKTTNDDIALRIMRDGLCLGPVVWTMIGSWDTIIAKHWPEWRFLVAEYPPAMSYLPYAVVVFLLGNIGLNMWNRK